MRSVWLIFCDCGFHSVCPGRDKDKRLAGAPKHPSHKVTPPQSFFSLEVSHQAEPMLQRGTGQTGRATLTPWKAACLHRFFVIPLCTCEILFLLSSLYFSSYSFIQPLICLSVESQTFTSHLGLQSNSMLFILLLNILLS